MMGNLKSTCVESRPMTSRIMHPLMLVLTLGVTLVVRAENPVGTTVQTHVAPPTSARQQSSSEELVFFEEKIRPLLINRCYECHSEKKQKGGLRLDSHAAWQKGGDSGAVIVPGNPETSLLIKAVRYGDKDLQMPPKRQLAPEETAALEKWVKLGAPDPREEHVVARLKSVDMETGRKHWAFQPVADPMPPRIAEDQWSRQPLDPFVYARLQKAGLRPNIAADRRTLIRRATFDLTGLPPSAEDVDIFVKDDSPDAFEKVVNRLLDSPHYGEHWARHWLDVARYADTKGYINLREEKQFVHSWSYRDWVVRALNDDMAYDRFLLLQLAADQVEPPESPHLAAMGFLTLGRRFLGVTHDIFDDRIDVVTRTTLALSVACARCHDHKFDPIPTRDYYALYGVFQSCVEQVVPCAPPATDAAFAKGLRDREDKLRSMLAKRREEQATRVRARVTDHLIAQLELEKYPEQTFSQILDASDINPAVVRRWQSFLAEAEERHDPVFLIWHEFAKLSPDAFASHGIGATQDVNPLVANAFTTAPASMREVAQRYGTLFADVEKQWQAMLKSDPDAKALPDENTEALRRVLHGPDSPCTVPDEHLANSEWFFPTRTGDELWKLQAEVDRWLLKSPGAPAYTTILVDRAQPASPCVFKRGNPMTKGETVPRQFLQVLSASPHQPFSKGSGRLELAQAIIAPGNPLTARVIVNRVWMQHFGRGLVATPSDFGLRTEPPSHPELLDRLARRFMDEGWSLKKLHRHILLSATYQQSSLVTADNAASQKAHEIDPENRLLWRMNTHRLTFEEMRDAWLAATGELDLRVGGKPVELFAANNTRRTLYALVDREKLPTVMRMFDFANPDISIPQRNDTIVPQQALFGLNHPFLAARAKALAQRTESAGNENSERVKRLYAVLFQRTATDTEIAAAIAFVQPSATDKSAPAPGSAIMSAWQQLAQTLMLTNEFVFVD